MGSQAVSDQSWILVSTGLSLDRWWDYTGPGLRGELSMTLSKGFFLISLMKENLAPFASRALRSILLARAAVGLGVLSVMTSGWLFSFFFFPRTVHLWQFSRGVLLWDVSLWRWEWFLPLRASSAAVWETLPLRQLRQGGRGLSPPCSYFAPSLKRGANSASIWSLSETCYLASRSLLRLMRYF